jgi:hypothetical protein
VTDRELVALGFIIAVYSYVMGYWQGRTRQRELDARGSVDIDDDAP